MVVVCVIFQCYIVACDVGYIFWNRSCWSAFWDSSISNLKLKTLEVHAYSMSPKAASGPCCGGWGYQDPEGPAAQTCFQKSRASMMEQK